MIPKFFKKLSFPDLLTTIVIRYWYGMVSFVFFWFALKRHGEYLKGLSHEMVLAFDDMYG
jgi:hypothetical protein